MRILCEDMIEYSFVSKCLIQCEDLSLTMGQTWNLLGSYTEDMSEEVEAAPVRQLLELTNVDDLKAHPRGGRTGGRKPDESQSICRSNFSHFVRSGAV